MNRLHDKIAIVSTAANGIGRAISLRFAEEGAWVLVTDIDERNGRKVVDEIRSKNGRTEFAQSTLPGRKRSSARLIS